MSHTPGPEKTIRGNWAGLILSWANSKANVEIDREALRLGASFAVDEFEELKSQRDELLEALKHAQSVLADVHSLSHHHPVYVQMADAITKATEEAL